jgi:protease-4
MSDETPNVPRDPARDPLPTTRVAPPPAAGPAWGAPWGPPPGPYGAWPGGPPPPPPKRDRLALAIGAVVFGGLALALAGLVAVAWTALRGDGPRLASGPRIGVLELRGTIGGGRGSIDSQEVLKQLRRFSLDGDLKAIVVRIDSPGGSVAPSQEIYDEIAKVAGDKTVVCSMGDLAASGGLYIALACPTIVAEAGTLTGSIGVITQFPNVKKLADRLDVKVETVKSGALKDAGNPLRDMTPAEREYWQALVDQVYEQFVRAVVESRELAEEDVRKIADGRVFTGEQAKELGLVDELGNFHDAVDLAREQAKLEGEPRLVYPPEDRGRLLEELIGGVVRGLADGVRAELAREAIAAERPGVFFLAR